VRLSLKVGDLLDVGRAKLRVAAVIVREPDSVLDYFGIAPRVPDERTPTSLRPS